MKAVQWREMMEPKSIPWEVVEDFGMEQYLCGMREQFTVKSSMDHSSSGGCGERQTGRHTR